MDGDGSSLGGVWAHARRGPAPPPPPPHLVYTHTFSVQTFLLVLVVLPPVIRRRMDPLSFLLPSTTHHQLNNNNNNNNHSLHPLDTHTHTAHTVYALSSPAKHHPLFYTKNRRCRTLDRGHFIPRQVQKKKVPKNNKNTNIQLALLQS
jgi:hypothetical protein